MITTRLELKEAFPIFLQTLVAYANIVIRHYLFMWNLVVFKLRKLVFKLKRSKALTFSIYILRNLKTSFNVLPF